MLEANNIPLILYQSVILASKMNWSTSHWRKVEIITIWLSRNSCARCFSTASDRLIGPIRKFRICDPCHVRIFLNPRNKYFFEILAYANYINALVSDCNVITQMNGFRCVEFYRSIKTKNEGEQNIGIALRETVSNSRSHFPSISLSWSSLVGYLWQIKGTIHINKMED